MLTTSSFDHAAERQISHSLSLFMSSFYCCSGSDRAEGENRVLEACSHSWCKASLVHWCVAWFVHWCKACLFTGVWPGLFSSLIISFIAHLLVRPNCRPCPQSGSLASADYIHPGYTLVSRAYPTLTLSMGAHTHTCACMKLSSWLTELHHGSVICTWSGRKHALSFQSFQLVVISLLRPHTVQTWRQTQLVNNANKTSLKSEKWT